MHVKCHTTHFYYFITEAMCEIPKTLINCELFSSLDQFSSKFFYVSTFIEIVHQKIEIIVDCIEIMV